MFILVHRKNANIQKADSDKDLSKGFLGVKWLLGGVKMNASLSWFLRFQ